MGDDLEGQGVPRRGLSEGMPVLRPFFSFYGSKHRIAGRYPHPLTERVIEPCAGSAGYALRHHNLQVLLLDVNPTVAGIWSYLIKVREEEIHRIPLLTSGEDVSVLRGQPREARDLVGFWLRRGAAHPAQRPSAWMREGKWERQFWGSEVRSMIASQLKYIRHWEVRCAPYSDAPDVSATWFVDPPYQGTPGQQYRRWGSDYIDYGHLGEWCVARRGQVIVCERTGARWLPFSHIHTATGTQGTYRSGVSHEAMWHQVALPTSAVEA